MKRFVFLFVILTLLCIFVGCSTNGDSEDAVPFDGVYLSGKILFNGMPLPSIALLRENGEAELVKSFGYEDFKGRLS